MINTVSAFSVRPPETPRSDLSSGCSSPNLSGSLITDFWGKYEWLWFAASGFLRDKGWIREHMGIRK